MRPPAAARGPGMQGGVGSPWAEAAGRGAASGVFPRSIARPQSLIGLPGASHSRMSQWHHPSPLSLHRASGEEDLAWT